MSTRRSASLWAASCLPTCVCAFVICGAYVCECIWLCAPARIQARMHAAAVHCLGFGPVGQQDSCIARQQFFGILIVMYYAESSMLPGLLPVI